MRKLGIVVGIIVAVLVIAVLIFWATFDVNHYRGRIQSELETRLGRKVNMGDMHLSLFPPSFQVNNIAIADDPAFADPRPFVKAEQLSVSVELLPLLHGDVQINSLSLQKPTVELIKNREGVWNFASLGSSSQGEKQQGSGASTPGTAPSGKPAGGAPPAEKSGQFSLSELSVKDGQVAITDQQAGQPRSVYDHIDLALNDFAPNRPFSLTLAAHLPGAGNQQVSLSGKGGPIAHDALATPFDGTINLQNVAISGLKQFLNSPALANMEGTISGQTKINNQGGKVAASGQTTVEKARINNVDVGYPIVANYDASDNLKADLLTINRGDIKLRQTPLSVTGTVNTKPTPADLNVNLKANNVAIAELARLASAFGVAFRPGTTVNGQINANIQARGAASKPALNGNVSANNVEISGADIPQPVKVSSLVLQLTPQQITSNNFNIVSGGTTANSHFSLRQYTSNSPVIDAVLQAPNAQLPAILSMAKAYGVKSLDKINGAGTMNVNMNIAGPVQSLSSDQVMRGLNGTMNVNFNNVHVNGTDLSHQLGAIAGFAKGTQADRGYTEITQMLGNIAVTRGVAQTNNLQALLDIGKIGITGTADLVTQTLNLSINAILSKTTSQGVGGTSIGGYMNTALANNQGELVIPILVTGTFQNPKIAPDVQKMAQMKLKGIVPNFSNPGQAATGILGSLMGQKAGQNAQQKQPTQPQNAVQQLLGAFGQKQNKPAPKKKQ